MALGFGGLALVVWQKLGMGEIHGLNFLLALGALLSITAGTLYQKRFVAPCDVRTASLVQLCCRPDRDLAAGAAGDRSHELERPTRGGAMAWSVLALTLGGSSLLYLLIQRGAATAVTSLLYLVPPCTAVMAWLLFGEAITASTVAGMALTAVGRQPRGALPLQPRP